VRFSIFCIFDHFADAVSVPSYLEGFARLAERAEELGFDGVWVSEHHFTPYGGIQPRPQLMLAHLAARTRRIRLGTAVSLVPFDNPIRLAEDFAFLDVISGGRLDWGVGRGLFAFEYDGMGISQDEGRERLEEAVDVVLRAWQEESLDYAGRFTNADGLRVLPRPLQKPHPPVYAAAVSPESVTWVARRGLHNLQVPYVAPLEVTDERLASWRAQLDAFGRGDAPPRLVVMMHTYVGQTALGARRDTEGPLGRYLRLVADHFPTQVRSKQYETYAQMAPAVKSMTPDQLFDGGRVVIGDADQVTRRIAELHARFGLDEYMLFVNWGGLEHALTDASLERFATRVMPELR
jgi:alkanesulfonate monooxygenase SsuD/methylene tetrahydromethanopterin reductase-like flavin-dependent oxidoreductase (luciferase family)